MAYDSKFLLGKYVRIKDTEFTGEVSIINTRGDIVWVKSKKLGGRSAHVNDLIVLPPKVFFDFMAIAFWLILFLISLFIIFMGAL